MKQVLYPMRSTREGRKVGEFPVGSVVFRDGQVLVDVPDRKLQSRLEALFGETYRVRRVQGGWETALAHSWEELPPGSERHFDEGLRRLLRLDLTALPE